VDELAEDVVVLDREPEHAAMTLTGMCWAYCWAASTTVAPGSIAPMSSRRCRHTCDLGFPRLDLLRRRTAAGAAEGEGVERRIVVIGGAPPIGGWASIVDVLTTTRPAREVVRVVGDLAHELGG
jgi:hypothetical protein